MVQRGFSLLELLLVLALVGLMAAMVGSAMLGSVSSAELRNASRGLLSSLRYTRTHAMVTHQEQVLLVDTDNKRYTPPGRDPVALPEGLDISLTTASQELVSDGVGGIRFFPDGASTGGNVTLHVKGREYRINVAWLTGESSMESIDS